ncbi:MAG: hypothetical protein WBA09_22530 [Candidatus Acidiferrum sp.]
MKKKQRKHQKLSEPAQAIVKTQQQTQIVSIPEAIEKVLILGDLASLTPQDRVDYYKRVCDSLGLNPLTMPFSYILFREYEGGTAKLSLYANKSCTEQLRKIHGVSVVPPMRRSRTADVVTVECDVRDKFGRTDTASGSVPLYKFKDGKRINFDGKDLCNAEMKCETKAKRRATLSICGLAFLDESELDTMEVIGGVTQAGRIYQFEEAPQNGSREAAQEVAQRKIAELTEKASQTQKPVQTAPVSQDALSWKKDTEKKADEAAKADIPKSAPAPKDKFSELKYELTVDWSLDKNAPVLTGHLEELGVRLANEKPPIKMEWGKDSLWHAPAKDVETIMRVASREGFAIKEIHPKQVSGTRGPGASGQPAPGKTAGTAGQPGARASEAASPAALVMTGVIKQAMMATTGKPRVIVLFRIPEEKKELTMSSWDQAHWKDLTDQKATGKPARLKVSVTKKGDNTYHNIVGLVEVNGNPYDEDGKTRALSVNREAGQRTLY